MSQTNYIANYLDSSEDELHRRLVSLKQKTRELLIHGNKYTPNNVSSNLDGVDVPSELRYGSNLQNLCSKINLLNNDIQSLINSIENLEDNIDRHAIYLSDTEISQLENNVAVKDFFMENFLFFYLPIMLSTSENIKTNTWHLKY